MNMMLTYSKIIVLYKEREPMEYYYIINFYKLEILSQNLLMVCKNDKLIGIYHKVIECYRFRIK